LWKKKIGLKGKRSRRNTTAQAGKIAAAKKTTANVEYKIGDQKQKLQASERLIRVYKSDVFIERKKRIKRESGRRNTRAQAGCLCRVSGGCIQAFESHKAPQLRSCSLSFALPFFPSALLCFSLAVGFLSLLTRTLRSQTRSLKNRGVKMVNPIHICPQQPLFEKSKYETRFPFLPNGYSLRSQNPLCGVFFFSVSHVVK